MKAEIDSPTKFKRNFRSRKSKKSGLHKHFTRKLASSADGSGENSGYSYKSDINMVLGFWGKWSSIVLGLLFVMGLLISNTHLANLGIKDFSILDTRNIMVGALFVYYWGLLVITISVPLWLSVLFTKIQYKKIDEPSIKNNSISGTVKSIRVFIYALLYCAFMAGSLMYFTGLWIGVAYPSEQSWEAVWKQSPNQGSFILTFQNSYGKFFDSYLHNGPMISVVASFYTIFFLWLYEEFSSTFFQGRLRGFLRRFMEGGILLLAITTFISSLFVYAYYVYPNLRFNIGGGQPQIVQLQILQADMNSFAALGIDTDNEIQTKADSATLLTQSVAIWYQSSEYIYFTPLPHKKNNENAALVAIDKNKVLGMRYVNQSIKVESGGRITKVISLP